MMPDMNNAPIQLNWIKATSENIAALPVDTVCWCWSSGMRKAEAGVWKGLDGWRCHGQEHFAVSGVTRFIILPAK
jgi:hypothetical protein